MINWELGGWEMRIEYDAQDDILYIEFSNEPIDKDVSYGWNINIGFTENRISGITVLDAKACGYWPLENAKGLLPEMDPLREKQSK